MRFHSRTVLEDIMKPVPAQVESIEERDKRNCIALYQKAEGGNREIAQWLADHPTYTSRKVGEWLNCSYGRINYLRRWAKNGFQGQPFDRANKPDERARAQQPLKTKENFQDDDIVSSTDVEDPARVLRNIVDSISQQKAVAEAYRKVLKVSSFDREAKAEIYEAITQLIVKWRAVQKTLETKGQGNGKNEDN